MPGRLSGSSRHWQRHWSMLHAFVIDKIKLRTHVFLCQCRPYYFQHTAMEYRMIYHGWKINIFQSINVLLIFYQCQKALESWQAFALSSKNIFFLVVSIETLTFKNALSQSVRNFFWQKYGFFMQNKCLYIISSF